IPLMPSAGEPRKFAAPDLSGQSVMLVSQQGIEASLIARRLQRWGAQTCEAAGLEVALALLPERAWHAVLIDHALGADAGGAAGDQAVIGLHRLSGETVARGLARGTPDGRTGSGLAKPCRRRRDHDRRSRRDGRGEAGARPVGAGRRGQRDQRAPDALAADAAWPSIRDRNQ